MVADVEVEQRERDVGGPAAGDGLDALGAIAAAVASCCNTRKGSSVDSTVTAVPSRSRWVES